MKIVANDPISPKLTYKKISVNYIEVKKECLKVKEEMLNRAKLGNNL